MRKTTEISAETLTDFTNWIAGLPLRSKLIRSPLDKREAIWIKKGSNLCSTILKPNETSVRHRILLPKCNLVIEPTERIENFFNSCMSAIRQKPNWDSALVSKGESTLHREHQIFQKSSVLIPIKDSQVEFKDQVLHVTKGSIYFLNCKEREYKIKGFVVQVFQFKPDWENYLPASSS